MNKMPKYRLLKAGDLIEEGDEFYQPDSDQWVFITESLSSILFDGDILGKPWHPDSFKPVRRPNPEFKPIPGKRCPECNALGDTNGSRHGPLCSHITLTDAKEQLKTYYNEYQTNYRSYQQSIQRRQSQHDERTHRLKGLVTAATNKALALKHENNELRKQLRQLKNTQERG